MKTLGFIGMGNMGQAMLKGCLNVFKAEELVFTALLEEECRAVSEKTGVGYVMDAAACAADVKYLVLAIKPQVYPEILKTLSGKIRRDQIVISIAPSYSIAQVKEGLGGEVRVVRAMPNTPAMVGEGMSGVCFSGDIYSDEEVFGKKFPEFIKVLSSNDEDYLKTFDNGIGAGIVFKHPCFHYDKEIFKEWDCGYILGTILIMKDIKN